MTDRRIRVVVEVTPKKAFASALDWPGWSRSAKTPEAAVEVLLDYADRYRIIAREAGEALSATGFEADVLETLEGDATTAFGAPSMTFGPDRTPTTEADAKRIARLVEAAWSVFDRTAAAAPAELRKGPRGGGRDTAKIVEHVAGADEGYARQIGVRARGPELRAAVLEVLRQPSDGIPLRKWTQRYAARRIAWHALDHAWEIEDRSTVE